MSQMVRDKFISLFERRPDLLSEWHPAKNGDIRPEDISFGSGRKIWWQCSQGHEWQAFPYRRSEGSGCPYCANQKVLIGYNDMATTHPELLCDWDYELNDDSPNSIIAGSNKKFHWKCATCGHQWVASANARTRSGCRECGKAQLGQLVHLSALRKTGSLTITHPHLLAEWNSIKNGTLMPTDVTAGSHKKVWWICDAGHDFYTSVYERVHSNGCPICSNRQVLSGYNDLESQYPAIAQEWDYEKNHISPNSIYMHAEKKVWWICATCQHSWQTQIALRTIRGYGCPQCARLRGGKKRHQKYLDAGRALTQTHPELAAQWHPTKNHIKPDDVVSGSDARVWWLGPCGHEWQAVVNSRAQGCGCPVCTNHQVLSGYNDLETLYPDLIAEYDECNTTPANLMIATSHKKANWTCLCCGHKYSMAVELRTLRHRGCPKCHTKKSVAETFILYYLQQIQCNVISSYKPHWLLGKEIDVFLPDIQVGIEYDGVRYHQNADRDVLKSALCHENRVQLVRIREVGCSVLNTQDVIFERLGMSNLHSLTRALQEFFQWLHETFDFILPDIDVDRDYQAVYALRARNQYEKSIGIQAPHLLADWDVANVVHPFHVSFGSNIQIHWKCHICGHCWTAVASSRVRGNGCPACAVRNRRRRGGRFNFSALGIPCGADITFLPNPDMRLTVAPDGASLMFDGSCTSLTNIVTTFFQKPKNKISQYFTYKGQTLWHLSHA